MPKPVFMHEANRRIAEGSEEITKEELDAMREITVEEVPFAMPHDVLMVKDVKDIPELADFHFGWLNPKQRERVGMNHWRWVNGALANLVREHGIVQEAVGGSSAGSIIQNGDLILGFMPLTLYQAQKEYKSRQSREAMESIRTQEQVANAVNAQYQEAESTMEIKRTYEGREIGSKHG